MPLEKTGIRFPLLHESQRNFSDFSIFSEHIKQLLHIGR